MTTQQLKESLIYRISEIEDHTFLDAVKIILDVKIETEMIELPNEFFAEMMGDTEGIGKGQSVDDDLLEQEIDEWLKEKLSEFD